MTCNKPRATHGKRILLVTERFHPEEFRINDLALEWKRKGYEVRVLTQFPSYPFGRLFDGYRNALFARELWQGIEICRVWAVTGYRDSLYRKMLQYLNYLFLGTLFGLLVGRGCDTVFVYHLGPLTDAVPAIAMGRLFRKPVTVWTTDIWPDAVFAYGFKRTPLRERLLGGFVRWVYRHCRHILVSSEGFVDKLAPYAGGKPIHHVPYWGDEMGGAARRDAARPITLSEDPVLHFTFAGNIGKVQNLEQVILGFGMASQQHRMQLNIIGDGSNLKDLQELVRSRGIEHVVFWGRKPSTAMPEYYQASDVLVISLMSDPLLELTVPSKFQTYLSVGKPVFAVMNGEVRTVVEKYRLGLTAGPGDLQEIREGFERFSSLGGEVLAGFADNCVGLYRSRYDKARNIDTITSFLF